MNPHEYAATHGPRAGDRVRLGDSGLVIRVESDAQRYGDEFLAGFGKTAAGILRRLFPGRTVTPVDARTIFSGGGGIHCITQQQPRIQEP